MSAKEEKAIQWRPLPCCPGEYCEILADCPIPVTVETLNWSNKEQRRMPISDDTKWGAWVSGGNALSLDYTSRDMARRAGVAEATNRLREQIYRLDHALRRLEAESEAAPQEQPRRFTGDIAEITDEMMDALYHLQCYVGIKGLYAIIKRMRLAHKAMLAEPAPESETAP